MVVIHQTQEEETRHANVYILVDVLFTLREMKNSLDRSFCSRGPPSTTLFIDLPSMSTIKLFTITGILIKCV